MKHEWVAKVIEEGDYEELDRKAKSLGERLRGATRTQVRSIFGTVKRLETLHGTELERDLVLLRPRLAYTASRAARANELSELAEVLTDASTLAAKDRGKRVQRLVDLMEAILCYSIAERS